MPRFGKDHNSSAPTTKAKIAAESAKRDAAAVGVSGPAWLRIILPLAVMGITFFVFLPALQNGFVNWDDDQILLENEHFRGLGGPQLHWMWTTYWMGHYQPLTWLSFAVDYKLWGLDENNAFGFHLTSVILHSLNAGLFCLLARRLISMAVATKEKAAGIATGAAAGLAAMLFAIHPLRVESVVWATDRGDLLVVVFLLPCLLAYLKYVAGSRGSWGWYVVSIACLLLSLLCKAWAMTLPVVLLILDWYPLGRFRRTSAANRGGAVSRLLIEKLPFIVLAGWAANYAARAKASSQLMMATLAEHGWLARIAQAFYGVVFYLWKTLWPTRLSPIDEFPLGMRPFETRFLFAAALVVAITATVVLGRRRWPAGLTLWGCYIVVLSPVLGLAQAGPQFVADRYSYVACMTWALLAGAGLLRMVRSCEGRPRRNIAFAAASVAALGVLAILGTLTRQQTRVWRDSETLWRHTLAVAPDSYCGHSNLAGTLAKKGDLAAAELHNRAALAINPDGVVALTNFGGLLSNSRRYEEALPYLERARLRNPRHEGTAMNLAIALQRLGRYEEAVSLYREQLAADAPLSQQAGILTSLGGALGGLGRLSEAADCLRKAAALAPKEDLPLYGLGLVLLEMGDVDGSLRSFEAAARAAEDAIQADPKALARTHLVDELVQAGELYMAQGDAAAARQRFQRALQLAPGHEGAREALSRIDASK
jgi:tetratricopeptide (TPR) repeat protein